MTTRGYGVAFIRLWLVLLVVQMVFYVLLRLYVRSQQVERLEDRWDARHPDQAGNTAARRAFVAKAMTGFNRSLRARLTLLVFVLPTAAILAIVILVNWQ
ncbi:MULTISPECIES: hypothetical protein [Paracoccus]|uniref:hypothetical protein n=1 Tax=Paracoccus TaxID=265 RepID=UPI0023F42A38|nr:MULTISPECIES: hypothetical protein [Paracoccus]